MRKLYWYLTAYLRKHGLKFLLAIIFGITIFSFAIPSLIRAFSRRTTRYIGIIGEYSLQNLPSMIKEQLSLSLMVAEPDGTFVPSLADTLTIKDGTSYVFTFETPHFWQDGAPFETTDVDYHLHEAQVTYTENQIVYDLPEIFASFPQLLTEPILKYGSVKQNLFWEREHVYGLSDTLLEDYTFADRTRGTISQMILFNQKTRDRYIYRFYNTEIQAIDAFKLGEIDYLFDVSSVEEIKHWETTAVTERLLPDRYLAVFFNTADPVLGRNLRLALSYAIEKERPGYTRALGPISESSWAFFSGSKRYDKNIDSGVERLLEELPAAPLELEFITTASYFDLATRIKQDWEELGAAAAAACLANEEITEKTPCEYLRISVTIQIQNFPDTNNFQTLLIGQQVALDPDQYNLWHSDLATNFTHYQNTKVDALLERGRQTIDPKERLTLYQEFQQNLLEDPPAVFLWYLNSSDVARK